MEEFALKIQLISQETLRASLAAWLDFWTVLIAIGVAVEISDLVWEYVSEWKDSRRGIIHTPEKPSFAKFFIGIIAVGLVIAGIAGEWYLQVEIGEAESKIERIADELLAREQRARTAMLLQLKPRDFTDKQMEDFVGTIKGRLDHLNVFTLPDPEAIQYAFAVMEGLRRAGVKVTWYRTSWPYFLIPGVGSSGLEIYEFPMRKVGLVLMDAFMKAGQSVAYFTPEDPRQQDKVLLQPGGIPLSSIPSPALFIGLKPIPFAWFPGYLRPKSLEGQKPPWESK